MTTGFLRLEKYDMQIHIKSKKRTKNLKYCGKHEGKFQYPLITTNINRFLQSEFRGEIYNLNPLNALDDMKKTCFPDIV
jgi:hypothetical protein